LVFLSCRNDEKIVEILLPTRFDFHPRNGEKVSAASFAPREQLKSGEKVLKES
jgi:hypothetical protein